MIVMIIAEERALSERFNLFLSPLGYSTIQYSHPVKAFDNIAEIHPDVLVCNAVDYPRHWKILMKEFRSDSDREDTVAVLLVDDFFNSDEADKATLLGVNYLVNSRMESEHELMDLEQKINRYCSPLVQTNVLNRVPLQETDTAEVLFQHPDTSQIVGGCFKTISPSGGNIRLDIPDDMSGIEKNTIIRNASVKLKERLFYVDFKVFDNAGSLSVVFTDFSENGYDEIVNELFSPLDTCDAVLNTIA